MSQIQNKLEQVFKEYVVFKEYIEANKKSTEELRTEVAEKVLGNEDKFLDIMFEFYGEKQLEYTDLSKLGTRLLHYYDAYQDLVEVPENIKKEVESLSVKYLFAVKNGKRETVDKDLYEECKKQFKEVNQQLTPN